MEVIAKVQANAPVKCGSAVGITTYIATQLRNGVGRYRNGGKRLSNANGLRIGRQTDVAFQRAVVSGRIECPRLRSVFRVLKKLRIKVVATQTAVVDAGLKTRLDGLGYIAESDTFVVLELKTTQRSRVEHQGTYKTACSHHPQMANGRPNSEYESHQIQTAFGMRAFARMFRPAAPVIGLVLVSCRCNGTSYYQVAEAKGKMPELFQAAAALPAHHSGNVALQRIEPKDANTQAGIALFGSRSGAIRLSADKRVGQLTLKVGGTRVVFGVVGVVGANARKKAVARLRKSGKRKTVKTRWRLLVPGPAGTLKVEHV